MAYLTRFAFNLLKQAVLADTIAINVWRQFCGNSCTKIWRQLGSRCR